MTDCNVIEETKECYRCKLELPLSNFGRSRGYNPKRPHKVESVNISCNRCMEPKKLKESILKNYSDRNKDWFLDEGIFKQ